MQEVEKNEGVVTGRKLSEILDRRLAISVADFMRRYERLYPSVRRRCRDPDLVCSECGHVMRQSLLSGDEYLMRTLAGRHDGPADDDDEDEHVTVCRQCGALESFLSK